MIIEFLVSTTNRTSLDFLNEIFQEVDMDGVKVLVINQCFNILPQELKTSSKNIRCISVNEKGISNSRNLAIRMSVADICVLVDDDVIFRKNSIDTIQNAFKNNEFDICTFKLNSYQDKPINFYHKKNHEIKTQRDIMLVTSSEIAFKREPILKAKLTFNADLGLGATYPRGEENVFIFDCLKAGLKAIFIAKTIAKIDTNWSVFTFDKNKVIAQGILYKKLFPFSFLLVDIYFTLKKIARYRKHVGIFGYLVLLIKGNLLVIRKKI